MLIHTNIITNTQMYATARRCRVQLTRCVTSGSRTHVRKFDVLLSGDSNRMQNNASGDQAATWDQWGTFLAELFRLDPGAVVPSTYWSKDYFHWATGGRFMGAKYKTCRQHDFVWASQGARCKCGAINRSMTRNEWFAVVSQRALNRIDERAGV